MSKTIAQIKNILEEAYTKAELILLLPLVDQLLANHKDLLVSEGINEKRLVLIKNKKHESKGEVAEYIAPAFVSEKAYHAFRACMKPEVRKIWDSLIWVQMIDHLTVKKDLGITTCKILPSQHVFYGRQDYASVFPEFEFMVNQKLSPTISLRELPRKLFFSLPVGLRNWIKNFHDYPEDGKLIPYEEIPPTDYVFQAEQIIQTEWPRILTYKSQGLIASTQKNRPVNTTLSKMQRILAIEEFFPKTSDKRLHNLRTSILSAMALNIPTPHSDTQVTTSLSVLFNKIYTVICHSAPMVLPDLKGMGMIENWDFHLKEHIIFQLLTQLPSGRWVPFKNIEKYTRYNNLEIQPLPTYQAYNKLYYEYQAGGGRFYSDKHYIRADNFQDAVELPFLRGSFFLFAAFGLCDIAYDEPDLDNIGRTSFSSWDGIRFVRRTALGDYLCGITKEYTPARTESESRFVLSPDTLLILFEGDNLANTSLLEPYAERIGTSRFRTDAQIFLKNVRSKKELESKIDLFKYIIQQDLPENWTAFFQDLLLKINPFEQTPPHRVLKIPHENKALIRLFAQDPVLKTLVWKAEGFYIIVPDDKYNAMKRRLQEFGYLLA